jgi:hypothetical protein
MSTHEWIPDKSKSSDKEKPPSTVQYLLVPTVRLEAKVPHPNLAGWFDKGENSYSCKTCKKNVPMLFQFLALFPALKANIDVFQFVYRVAEHKKGGAFSREVCPESNTGVNRTYENPTAVRLAKVEVIENREKFQAV